jgi:hypothetical protein
MARMEPRQRAQHSYAPEGAARLSDEAPPDRERRGPGRPPVLVDPSELTIRLDGAMHNDIIEEARKRGVAPGAFARALLSWAVSRLKHSERIL